MARLEQSRETFSHQFPEDRHPDFDFAGELRPRNIRPGTSDRSIHAHRLSAELKMPKPRE
jgi:hypothetical protein